MKDLSTLFNHQEVEELSNGNRPLVPPTHTSTKYTFNSVNDVERLIKKEINGYFYSRFSNPTVKTLEKLLAKAQGREEALCTASGISAIALLIFALLKPGMTVLFFLETYAPTRHFFREYLKGWGVNCVAVSGTDKVAIEKAFEENTIDLVWFESPTNPQLAVVDINHLVGLSRAHGATTVMDNTFAGVTEHSQFEVDYYMHSLTKFVVGHGNASGGVVIANKDKMEPIYKMNYLMGPCLDATAAERMLTSLKTYNLRFEKAVENAQRVAEHLEGHQAVEWVRYPGLKSHPQHEISRKQTSHTGVVVYFRLKDGADNRKFIDKLNVFQIAGSLGSTESLVIAPDLLYGGNLSDEERERCLIDSSSVRLSVGIENVSELISDLDNALGEVSNV